MFYFNILPLSIILAFVRSCATVIPPAPLLLLTPWNLPRTSFGSHAPVSIPSPFLSALLAAEPEEPVPDLDPALIQSIDPVPVLAPARATRVQFLSHDAATGTATTLPLALLGDSADTYAIPTPTVPYLKKVFADSLPDKVRVTLDQSFGKNSITQSFTADVRLRHVLLPLFKSNCLCLRDRAHLDLAYRPSFILRRLLNDHADVDFSTLPGFQPNWEEETDINEHRVRMITAAFLHFDGCAATVVRYMGGPHTAAHRDPDAILSVLRPSVDPQVLADLERIFKFGVPNYINAHSSEENFQAFRHYGNHGSVDNIPDADARKTLVKNFKRGYVLVMNKDLLDFIPNMHLTPQGIVDLDHPHKNPRPIFDSSCRPQPWCSAINDWTNKRNEPNLIFATGFMLHLIWLWNLRISYPHEEIYIGDNDVSGAFNHNKYNPMLVALHAFVLLGYLVMNSATSFGDNSSPSNFEPLAQARQQHAKHLWLTSDNLTEQAAQQGVHVQLSLPPTPSEVSQFSPGLRRLYQPWRL